MRSSVGQNSGFLFCNKEKVNTYVGVRVCACCHCVYVCVFMFYCVFCRFSGGAVLSDCKKEFMMMRLV